MQDTAAEHSTGVRARPKIGSGGERHRHVPNEAWPSGGAAGSETLRRQVRTHLSI